MENDKVQIIPLTVGYNDLETVGAVTILDPRVEELLATGAYCIAPAISHRVGEKNAVVSLSLIEIAFVRPHKN